MEPNERHNDQIESVELAEDELDDVNAGGPYVIRPTSAPGT